MIPRTLTEDALCIVLLCFFLAGVRPVVSLGEERRLLRGGNPSMSPKRLATGALAARTGEDWGACAMFISPLMTLWGMISERGGGFGLAMVVLMIFFVGCKFRLCRSITRRREKIRSDLKKVNAPWSL